MAEKHVHNWNGTVTPTETVHLHCESMKATQVVGDLYLTPRTWVRDALEAKPGALFTTAFITAFAAALGAGAAVIVLGIVWGAVRHG